MTKVFKNFIAGEWASASSGETFDNVNPADTSDVIGTFPLSSSEDVARAVAFFVSEDAAFITGQVLSVDGGMVMQ